MTDFLIDSFLAIVMIRSYWTPQNTLKNSDSGFKYADQKYTIRNFSHRNKINNKIKKLL